MSSLIKLSQGQGLLLPHQYLYDILCGWNSLLHDMLQRAVQTDLNLKNSWTCSLFYTHIWPFQQETKELGVRGTRLVANFVTTHFLPSSESSRAVKCKFRISLLFESWSFLEHTPYTSMSPGFKQWLAWLIGFSCHLQLTRRWIFLQSGQKCQIFCHFHQEIGGSLFKSFWWLHPSPWIKLWRLCLSGDQTCVSCKMHSWMLRMTCGGMSVSASTWVFLGGTTGLIVCVTHHHYYIDSLSCKMFQGDMCEMISKLVLRWCTW